MASSKLAKYDLSLIPSDNLPLVNPNITPVPELGSLQQPRSSGKRTASVIRTLGLVLALPLIGCALPPSACLTLLTYKMGSMI